MTRARWQRALTRAWRTFVQASLAYVVASGPGWVRPDVWRGAAVAGGAAVLAMLMNVLAPLEDDATPQP